MPRRPSTHVDDPVLVGRRVQGARRAAGLTQRQLSFDGCTSAYVSRIEAGARIPSLQILHEFAKRLGVTPEYLATGESGRSDLSSELLEAEVALKLGNEEAAATIYEAARAGAESTAALARAQLGLAQLALHRGEVQQGIELLEEALDSGALAAGDASVAADALGRSYVMLNRFDEAFAIFERFLDQAKARSDRFDQIRFALLLANTYIDHGDYARAHATLGEVLVVAQETVEPRLRASLYWSQSRVHLSEGDADRAAEYAQLALATLRSSEQTLEAARVLELLAFIENDRGNHEAALELVEEGEPVVVAAGEATDAAMFTVERARALAALGQAEKAAALLLGIGPRLAEAAPKDAGRAYCAVADIFRAQGDTARALELYELAADQAPVPSRHVAAALTAMAEIYEEQGDARRALELLKQALAARSGSAA
jgi:tetratricopeptide (TPR) repeat protein